MKIAGHVTLVKMLFFLNDMDIQPILEFKKSFGKYRKVLKFFLNHLIICNKLHLKTLALHQVKSLKFYLLINTIIEHIFHVILILSTTYTFKSCLHQSNLCWCLFKRKRKLTTQENIN